MKHISWNYRGYDDLNLGIVEEGIQLNWNYTLLNRMHEAWGDNNTSYNVFVSKEYLPIFESISLYNDETKTIGSNIKLIPMDINTPKLYITESWLDTFMGIQHDNYASVVIINCNKEWE